MKRLNRKLFLESKGPQRPMARAGISRPGWAELGMHWGAMEPAEPVRTGTGRRGRAIGAAVSYRVTIRAVPPDKQFGAAEARATVSAWRHGYFEIRSVAESSGDARVSGSAWWIEEAWRHEHYGAAAALQAGGFSTAGWQTPRLAAIVGTRNP